jgi:hypothetical protein
MPALVAGIYVFRRSAKDVDGRIRSGHDAICAALVPEVPRAGEHHGDAMVIGGFDHLVVAH